MSEQETIWPPQRSEMLPIPYVPAGPLTEAEIRADERAKCAAEIRALNASRIGYEWVLGSTWANIIERAAGHIERKG